MEITDEAAHPTMPPTSTSLTFTLNPALDTKAAADAFAQGGHTRLTDFLEEACAEALWRELRAREDWVQVINSGDKSFELDRPTRKSFSPEQAKAMDDAVYAGARSGFQFRYEAVRVPDSAKARAKSTDPLARFATWMSSAPVRALLGAVTGEAALTFADAQGTAYAPGDFLTAHDDAVAGKRRHAAYVLGLNPAWRAEWGGLLLLHDGGEQGRIAVPAFNTLDLIRVGQAHSVSEVTRAAPNRRYAVTGWMRKGPVPA
ncbi:2OG-Fe(II) oxygenase [Novosphingobium mangrovi (ex Hu et al. 2023)]|uniref:2OG-Fe(II) oxygenase n=1 Tax=Novosphingobium mangrovi (ex Hu et al. 2023) TaxID=2930094 RepID=A0ABT0AH42_9SPHN|nr:2OG-Fe(II) oxygenase family protein [Novosphingobium mangrovi (ex Hu et al. 2023)]MCJ1962487.1 2OG-Fe(II) oxygenase [Novosphingobium mangrovi (ex Hu et al. 2023)]